MSKEETKKTKKEEGDKKKESSEKKEKKEKTTTGGEKKSSSSTKKKEGSSSSKKKEGSSSSNKKEKKGETRTFKNSEEALKYEHKRWAKKAATTNLPMIEWVSIETAEFIVNLKFADGPAFTVTYPENYPMNKQSFFAFSDGDKMDDWNNTIQDATQSDISFGKLLGKMSETYSKLLGGGVISKGSKIEFDDDYGGGLDEDDGFGFKVERKEKTFDAVDQEFSNKKFLEIGSPTASLRLLKDLKSIKRADPKVLGFTAEPRVEPGKNLENLYHWIVKLYFDGALGTDLESAKKKYGIDYVELEMRFSEHYPFSPPFVRVVRPRFQFRTGHVTVGGSICMELLTNSGWRSTNDIESILIQIRAEMQSGNARLDLTSSEYYSESEAWDAFSRAARTHGWDVKNIEPNMFPKIL